jgi:four helix bundle protein
MYLAGIQYVKLVARHWSLVSRHWVLVRGQNIGIIFVPSNCEKECLKPDMSYKKLEVYKIAHMLALEIHKMTITKLPKFEMYEEGSQIRRSIKSVKTNIVEGYGRKRYRPEYIKFLTYAIASNDETIDHLRNLVETKSLIDKDVSDDWFERLDKLGRKIYLLRNAIEKNIQPVK